MDDTGYDDWYDDNLDTWDEWEDENTKRVHEIVDYNEIAEMLGEGAEITVWWKCKNPQHEVDNFDGLAFSLGGRALDSFVTNQMYRNEPFRYSNMVSSQLSSEKSISYNPCGVKCNSAAEEDAVCEFELFGYIGYKHKVIVSGLVWDLDDEKCPARLDDINAFKNYWSGVSICSYEPEGTTELNKRRELLHSIKDKTRDDLYTELCGAQVIWSSLNIKAA